MKPFILVSALFKGASAVYVVLFASEVKQEEPSVYVWLVLPVRKQVRFLFMEDVVINVSRGLLITS